MPPEISDAAPRCTMVQRVDPAPPPFVFDTLLDALEGPPLAHERAVWERDADADGADGADATPPSAQPAATPSITTCDVYTFQALRERFFGVPEVRAQIVAAGRQRPHATRCVLVSKRLAFDFVIPADGAAAEDALDVSVLDLYAAALDDPALAFASKARAAEAALRVRLETGAWAPEQAAAATPATEQAVLDAPDAPDALDAPDAAVLGGFNAVAAAAGGDAAAPALTAALARDMAVRLMTLPQDAGECLGGEATLQNKAVLAGLDTRRCVFQALDVELLDNSQLTTPTTLFCTLQTSVCALVEAADGGADADAVARAGTLDYATPLGAGIACASAGERQDCAMLRAAATATVRPCAQTTFDEVARCANMTPARLLRGSVAVPLEPGGPLDGTDGDATRPGGGLIIEETFALSLFLRANADALGLQMRGLRCAEDERLERVERERLTAAKMREKRAGEALSADETAAIAKASVRATASTCFMHVQTAVAEHAAALMARSRCLPFSDPLSLRFAVRPGIGAPRDDAGAPDTAAATTRYAAEDAGKTVRVCVRVWYTLVPRDGVLEEGNGAAAAAAAPGAGVVVWRTPARR